LGSGPPYPTTPVLVPGLTGVRAMDGGTSHTCVLFIDGTVKCWGENDQGQLGDGTFTYSATPVAVSGVTDAISLSAGNRHTCVVLSGGAAKCWGRNAVGQLGNGFTLNSPTPATVTGLTDAVTIHASDLATCALQEAGTIKCWGSNGFRQLGNGSPPEVNALTPVTVTGISDASTLAVGSDVNCAIVTGGALKCWGYNFYGEVGDGTTNPASTPITVPGLPPVRAVGGGDAFVCAVLIGGTVDCWGQNGNGQIGNGTFDFGFVVNPNPTPVTGLTDVVAIATGGSHTCVLTGTGVEKCWGYNNRGQLGDGTTTNAATPVTVLGL
jgi:alpha-tubulin suppressor-like RCC1 family protein